MISFAKKVETLPRKELEQLAFKMEDSVLSIIDEFSILDDSGEVAPINKQEAHIQELMELINW